MSDVLSRELPAPKRWQEFESLAFDLFSRIWKTTDAELHGRAGQSQAGVDVFGTNRVENLFTGVQCKGKDADYGGSLTEKELKDEVAKALTFQPPLEAFILVTTAPNDAPIQKVAREISAEHRKSGLFEVRVTGWDTLRHRIVDHQDLLIKYFRDFAPVDMLDQLATAQQTQAQQFTSITQMIRTQSRLITDIRDDRDEADDLATRASEIGKLIAEGSPRAAIRALDRLLDEEGEGASPLARYRILAGRGIAQFALGEEANASESFRRAYDAHPTYTNARATMGMALLLDGDRDGALSLAAAALKDDPTSTRTAGVVIDALPEGTPLTDIEAALPPNLLDHADVKIHLALRAAGLGDHDAHRRLSEEAYVLAPDDWRAMAGVAEALMQPLSALDGLALTHALPQGQLADVERAAELLSTAWTKLASRDSSFQGRHLAANLISLLGLLGRDTEAETVLDQALVSNPTYDPLANRSAQRFVSRGDWKSAAVAIDAVPEEERSFDSLLLRTQADIALADAGSARRSVELMVAKAAQDSPSAERDHLLTALRVRLAILEGADRDAAIEAATRAHPGAVVLRSILFDDLPSEGDLRAAIVEEIREAAKGELTLRERVHAADTLYSAGHHSLAADLYAPLHGRTDSYALRKRLKALHLADRRAEARKLFETLPSDLRASPDYVYVGINIYERAGLLKPALKLVEVALGREETLRLRIAWMQLLARLGRREQTVPWLEQVSERIEGSPDELMTLARVLDQYLGRDPKALAIGYRALRGGYGKPTIHLSFALGLIINGRPDDAAMAAPATIEPATGVALVNEGTAETIFRLIETEADPVVDRGEISPDDPFAARVLGLRVGDTIEIPKVGFEPQTYRVEEIQSRYLFAFRRTLRDFPALFPGNPAFGSFEIDEEKGDDRFEDMFALARRRAAFGNEIENMYRDNTMPLAMMAKFTGSSVFDLWQSFSSAPDLGLKSALGIAGEFEAGRVAARRPLVLVDPVSIYAWTRLGLGPTVLKSTSRLAVVQATIDMFRDLVDERYAQRGRKMGTFGWDGERYRFVELTEEAIERQGDEASAALAFAEALTLVPAESDRRLPDGIADLLEDLEPAYYDTLIASLDPKRALLTDDLGLRVVAQEAEAAVTWTQPFAQASLSLEGISQTDYLELLTSLLDANYHFTQFGHADILEELRNSGWAINDRLRRFAALMTSPTLDRASIAIVLASLLVDSHREAPDDASFATFHVAYANACREAGHLEQARADYVAAHQVAFGAITRSVNQMLLPRRLMETTNLTPPEDLAGQARRIATLQVDRIRDALQRGGFALD